MKQLLLAAAALSWLLIPGSPARANLIVNGGFETGDFTGWTHSGNLGYSGVGGNGHSGIYAAYLGPVGSDGFLSQIFATTRGAGYTLSYWLQNNGGARNDFAACLNGVAVPGSVLVNADGFDYTEFTFFFTASKAATTLKFRFRQDPTYWHLDDVDVEPQVAGVPEPGTLALAGCGVATWLGYRWQRRRQAASASAHCGVKKKVVCPCLSAPACQ